MNQLRFFKNQRKLRFPNLLLTLIFSAILGCTCLHSADLWAQSACQLPSGLQPISKCIDASHNAVVGPSGGAQCSKVFFDQDFTGSNALNNITVETGGELYLRDETRSVEVKNIKVSGLLQAGTQECPIGMGNASHQVTFTFLGSRPCASPQQCSDFNKGIEVESGGSLRLYGLKGVPASEVQTVSQQGISWTYLRVPAGPVDKYGEDSGALAPVPVGGGLTLHLSQDVTKGPGAWQKKDWISVATTGFNSVETEIVQIADLQTDPQGGTQVTLVQPLQHYHFGGADPGDPSNETFNECSGFNYGVDERAEVGLLSRNIKLTAKIEASPNDLHWGGEMRFLQDFKEVSVQGVEFEKFGKDQLASYPIHFHMVGDVSAKKPLINANSIHHSYNKCITLHMTDNVTIENNVCVRVVGHMFYEEMGYEAGIRFLRNLGLGTMSNYFDVVAGEGQSRDEKIKNLWWDGDHLGQKDSPDYNGYDGFNIPDTGNQSGPVRGVCASPLADQGGVIIGLNPNTPEHKGNCTSGEIYFEPASGFWIIHPGTELIGNSIGGCQDVGRGYWYVPPKNRPDAGVPPDLTQLSQKPLGTFQHNRVHGCYSGVYAEPEFNMLSEQLFPRKDGIPNGKNILAVFDQLISTRNRDRGVWLRPVWFVLTHGRFATNRNSVSLVSSGGLDGNAPGVWALLEDSVVVGLSQNNVDRWGPCPSNAPDLYDCVHPGKPGMSAPNSAKGFPSPYYNLSGYMIYDGPVRIFRDRFVNFNADVKPQLTLDDADFLDKYTSFPHGNFPNKYEGDAALGWFQNNQSAYPTGTVSRELSWDNVDLRHQIYTEKVNLGDFQDGDRNTAILDRDGTLTGFHVVDSEGNDVPGAEVISLNNLEFNQASNSVDECLAEGQQDTQAEGRPTSLISAGHYATLEFQGLFPAPLPTDPIKQLMTFEKDQLEFNEHPKMDLTSRNGLGVWEPKVASGYGYTVGASLCTRKPECAAQAGIPARVSVGLTDAIKPGISASDPFFVRVGICYTNQDGSHPPAGNFSIARGYRSWGGNGANTADKDLQNYFNVLINRYQSQQCHILDFQNPPNRDPVKGCPANAVTPIPPDGSCPAPSVAGVDQANDPACIYPKDTLDPAGGIAELTNPDGTPNLTKYFYDSAAGLLFFNVVQDIPNAFGPSPLGTCTGAADDDPLCPVLAEGESYYACPAGGCVDYVVNLGGTYNPGPSNCEPYPTYEQPEPAEEFKLAYLGSNTAVVPQFAGGNDGKFPHNIPDREPTCPTTVVAGASENDVLGIKFASSIDLPPAPSCPSLITSEFSGGGCSLGRGQAQAILFLIILLAPLALVWRYRRLTK